MSDFVILALILLLLLSLVATIAFLVVYSGIFSSIVIKTGSPPIKKVTIAYKLHKGPYKESGAHFTDVCSIGPKQSCIAVYYDDPKEVPEEKCRYAVGSIVSEGDEQVDEELLQDYKKFGFSVASFPQVDHAVTTTFPNRTPVSCMMGAMRVYPRLGEYITERKLSAFPWMEIYKDDLIHYMCPLARQNSFFVPEVCLTEKKEEESDEDGRTDVTGGDSNSESSYFSRGVPSDSRETSLAPSLAPSTIPQEEQEAQREQEQVLSEHAEHAERGSSNGSLGSGSSFEELGLEEEEEQEEEEEEEKQKQREEGEEEREEVKREEEGGDEQKAAAEEEHAKKEATAEQREQVGGEE
ncbi:testis-expressed protein 264 homolog [Engraulis encrasicolus]|uniref:testis-expressed protein 264 homolog n=1 Tax=Engraulis encrasicolus TaxID=184585 RepID=UPI002FD4A90E